MRATGVIAAEGVRDGGRAPEAGADRVRGSERQAGGEGKEAHRPTDRSLTKAVLWLCTIRVQFQVVSLLDTGTAVRGTQG